MQTNDLSIDPDITNLFDYTLNEDARATLRSMLLRPLPSQEAALERQHILKGFVANIHLFHTYSYSKIDFREAFTFLQTFTKKEFLPKRLKLRLWFSRKKHYQYRSRCVQLILLFHRLHNHYIKELRPGAFPESYKADIRYIDDFLSSFRLDYFERQIRSNSFRIKHIVAIINIIADKKHKQEFEEFHGKYTQFEAYLSATQGIHYHGFTFPDIDGTTLSLQDFYHPLLARPVKNSFTAESNVVLLTGPNMSGKSTLLKAIGICTYLANIGFAVPAAQAQVPFYGNISVYINLNDDLQSGYSHFMTEIMNLKNVALDAGSHKSTFAVFDELFRGTNIEDALEISKTTLRGLLNFPDSLFFVSSHLHQLSEMKEIKSGQISCHYLDCDLENGIPKFTYQLKPGWSDVKIGRILFERENLNEILRGQKILKNN